MVATTLRREESLGLAFALVAHAGLIGWLVWQRAPVPIVVPERMTVTISEDVGLTAAAPQQAAPASNAGPVQGEAPPPPETTPKVQAPASSPAAVAPPPRPAPVQVTRAPVKPASWPFAKPAAVTPNRTSAPAVAPPRSGKPGASAFDNAFKAGIPGVKPGGTAASAAAPITGAVRNSLAGAVARQLKPQWHGPSGLDVDKLATTVEWDLNPDGSLAGAPRIVLQSGITDANRAQADRHKEQALKAVRTAASFDLPAQYYAAWKHLRFTFDWKINQ